MQCSVKKRNCISHLLSTPRFALITLGEEVFYVGVQFVICVYINVLKEQENDCIKCKSESGGVFYTLSSHLLYFLQKCYNVCAQVLQFLVSFFQLEFEAAALLFHSFGSGISPALVRVAQRLEAAFILLEILFLKEEENIFDEDGLDSLSHFQFSLLIHPLIVLPKERRPIPQLPCC